MPGVNTFSSKNGLALCVQFVVPVALKASNRTTRVDDRKLSHDSTTTWTIAPSIQQHQRSKNTFSTLWETTLKSGDAENSQTANMKC